VTSLNVASTRVDKQPHQYAIAQTGRSEEVE